MWFICLFPKICHHLNMKNKLFIFLIIITTLGINFSVVNAATIIKNENKTKELVLPILMYHYIRDYYNFHDQVGINLSVSPKNFRAQLDCLNKLGYKTVTFNDLLYNNLPAKPIILTFDDGYKDFYTTAFKELKKRHMKAVIYIIVNKINAPGYLSLAELQELSNNNIEIGDHTWSHPDLRTLDNKKLIWEITVSKILLSFLFKKPILSLAYPSGKYDEPVVALVKKAGYNYAVTTNPGLANFYNNLTLNRLRILNNTNLLTSLNK